jgi:hypothetical protein
MNRTLVVSLLALGLAHPAFGDVTMKQAASGKGLGISGTATSVTYIKGNRMRTDTILDNKTHTLIFDVDAQKMYIFDSKKKEVDVWDMAAFSKEISSDVDVEHMKVSLKANGQTREIAGKTAAGYDFEASVPATIAGNKEMSMILTLSGPTWIVKGAPGTQDYANFYKGAVEKGWIFSDPRAAKAQPGQAKAMAEMYRQLAEAGGIAYETNMQMKMSGMSGPMAAVLAKMGNVSFATQMQSIETTALPDDQFAPPADYKLKMKK